MVRKDTLIATNTSSLRIDDIGQHMKHPERFVGMHFFNPVPVMPLVEIIQGTRTSDESVSTAVTWALKMGKTPIVVQDCPGFLVNRILTAYTRAFLQLIEEGADFEHVDKSMEAFGWPMGPAYLEDVIGIDTGSHVSDVISAGYPERMPHIENDAFRLMKSKDRLGQKNGKGFYEYTPDDSGRPQKHSSAEVHELLKAIQPNGQKDVSVEEIQQRMMLAMITEAVHCLEDKVVNSAEELDTALLMGVGFPGTRAAPSATPTAWAQRPSWNSVSNTVTWAPSTSPRPPSASWPKPVAASTTNSRRVTDRRSGHELRTHPPGH